MDTIAELVEGLQNKDNLIAYDCLKQLQGMSAESNVVYPYFDTFAEMLQSEHSYIRTRGMLLIAANAEWDMDNKIDEIIDEYLKRLEDSNPITVRQCIQSLPQIARFKPDLAQDIVAALRGTNTFRYKSTMQPLIRQDIANTLQNILEGEPESVPVQVKS
ncbi:MAG: SufBD protein [Clostridiaceae bacterium]